jgi:hypothetical protein
MPRAGIPWRWQYYPGGGIVKDRWELRDGRGRVRAEIWLNPWTQSARPYTWHTYDDQGTGGENADAASVDDAKLLCVACIVRQGWAPGGWKVQWR